LRITSENAKETEAKGRKRRETCQGGRPCCGLWGEEELCKWEQLERQTGRAGDHGKQKDGKSGRLYTWGAEGPAPCDPKGGNSLGGLHLRRPELEPLTEEQEKLEKNRKWPNTHKED